MEGEVVRLAKSIKVNEGENKGAVEKWLQQLQQEMISTL